MSSRRGKRLVRRRSPADGVGEWLKDQRVSVGDRQYSVERSLAQYDDRSLALLATELDTKRPMLLRTFDRQSKALDSLVNRSATLSGERGVAPYERFDSFTLEHPSFRESKGKVTLFALVREYEPKTLRGWGKNYGSGSPATAWRLLDDLAHGISALHDRGILIGGLKPSNVLITEQTEARIADYGLGMRAQDWKDFAAPEQLSAHAPMRARSKAADVYAFGKLARYLESKVPLDRLLERDHLSAVIAKCLELDPKRRPNIDHLIGELFGARETVLPNFGALASAAIADIDARHPESSPELLKSASIHMTATTETLDREFLLQHGYRLREFSNPERIHLTATLAMLQMGDFTKSSKFGTLVSIMREYAASGSSQDMPLDPLWAESIRERARVLTASELEGVEQYRNILPSADYERIVGPDTEQASLSAFRLREGKAKAIRSDLLACDDYIRTEHVAAQLSVQCPGITPDEVRALADIGYLLRVPLGDVHIYPGFQFDRHTHLPFPAMKYVNDRFRSPEASPWSVLGWWWRPNRYLAYHAPAQHLKDGGDDNGILDAIRAADAA